MQYRLPPARSERPERTEPPALPYIHCEDLFKIYKTEELEVVALRGLDLRRGVVLT